MPFVQTLSLQRITRTVNKLFTSAALIEQRAPGTGQFGDPTTSWNTVASNVPCRVIRTGPRVKSTAEVAGDELSIRDSYRLIVGSGVALTAGMRVTVAGLRYDIASIQASDTDSVFNEAFITRQRGDQP